MIEVARSIINDVVRCLVALIAEPSTAAWLNDQRGAVIRERHHAINRGGAHDASSPGSVNNARGAGGVEK